MALHTGDVDGLRALGRDPDELSSLPSDYAKAAHIADAAAEGAPASIQHEELRNAAAATAAAPEWRLMDERTRLTSDVAKTLREPRLAIPAREFLRSGPGLDQPGLYAWWADEAGLDDLCSALEDEIANPIYAGQTGATQWPSGRRGKATLGSRIRSNHIGGNITSSTFRRTLAAVLREPLMLELANAGRLTRESNARLSGWIQAHLSVVAVPIPDRDTLGALERDVLALLHPPLNLMGMDKTPARRKLTELRVALSVVHHSGPGSTT